LLDHWPHIQMPAEMDSLVVAMAKWRPQPPVEVESGFSNPVGC
jgi:hypothetical protein